MHLLLLLCFVSCATSVSVSYAEVREGDGRRGFLFFLFRLRGALTRLAATTLNTTTITPKVHLPEQQQKKESEKETNTTM